MAETKQQQENQRDRLQEYKDIHKNLDQYLTRSHAGSLSCDQAYRLSRMQDALAKAIRKHDPRGRTVGRILEWDKVGRTHG